MVAHTCNIYTTGEAKARRITSLSQLGGKNPVKYQSAESQGDGWMFKVVTVQTQDLSLKLWNYEKP